MTSMKITTIAGGTATSIMAWGGDLPTIPGMTPGITEAITVPGTTVAGMIPGFTDTAAGTA